MPKNPFVRCVVSGLVVVAGTHCGLGAEASASGGSIAQVAPPAATVPSKPTEAPPPAPVAPPVAPSAAPDTVPGAAARGPNIVDARIEELLDALEHGTDALKDFHANVAYTKFDAATNGTVRQLGRLLYVKGPDATAANPASGPATKPATKPGTKLGVFFDEYFEADGRGDKVDQQFVFADGWLCERDPGRKQFIKRQIVPPGESFDPLKLGEGPIPLPIGQRKSEVLRRYIVSTPPMPDAELLRGLKPESLRPLRLVPMTIGAAGGDTSSPDDFVQIDLFYDKETLLPVIVVATNSDGSRKTVKLSKLVRNSGVTEDERKMLSVETPPAIDWKIDVRPWRAAGQDPGDAGGG